MSQSVQRSGQPTGQPKSEDVVAVINPSGSGRVVLACEHAANAIPPHLHDLGLTPEALQSHIAWDIGALAVAKLMSAQLDATLIAHRVSRLVYDCNRTPEAFDAVPDISEYQDIPGNVGLSAAERKARADTYYEPFRAALSDCLAERRKRAVGPDAAPVLITVHSFTPVYKGVQRTVEIGILHDRDSRLADELLQCAQRDGQRQVLRNIPYGPDDGVTFTLVHHAMAHNLLNVMIEIRNDLIGTAADQQVMADRLSRYISDALAALEGKAGLDQVS